MVTEGYECTKKKKGRGRAGGGEKEIKKNPGKKNARVGGKRNSEPKRGKRPRRKIDPGAHQMSKEKTFEGISLRKQGKKKSKNETALSGGDGL